jgi:spore maturation protein CgeB
MIKKILFIALKYSYGKKERGEALNKKAHSDKLKELGYIVENLWLDDYSSNEELQTSILIKAKEFNPDMIFFKIFRFEIKFETLKKLKKSFFLVNWFGDDQWRFKDFTSKYANYFDICITTDKFSIEKYKAIGQKNIIRSQHASFENYNDYKTVFYKYDVSFIGGVNPFRKWFVKELKKRDIKVHCFGNGWSNGRITYDEMNNIMLNSKINLNISNSISYDSRYFLDNPRNILSMIKGILKGGSKNISQTKARIFEIPVRGGFELTEYVPTLEEYFCIGQNMVCYSSVDEAALWIKYYLDNEQERELIKINSVKHARANHTYKHRTVEFMKQIEEIYNDRER